MNNTLTKKFYSDKETLLAMVSHDLKNPVLSSLMAVDLLYNQKISPLNSYQKELIDNMFLSLKYMKMLIFNILDRYKLKNNSSQLVKTPIIFSEYIYNVLTEAKYIFTEKKQTLTIRNELKNDIITLDMLAIQRVINNLLVNSCKYSPKNSEIIINLFKKNNSLCFSIQNEGICNTGKIFEKFVVDNEIFKIDSTGLGLYIVEELIKMHNGYVFAENLQNKYTKITFALPFT